MLHLVARFHARDGCEAQVAAALRDQILKVRAEPGCISIAAMRATRDPRLFFIVSRWQDEAAFDIHAALATTQRFVETMQALIDHPFDPSRAVEIA